MKHLKYLLFSLVVFIPIKVGALEATTVLDCDKLILNVGDSTNCKISLNSISGGVKGFMADINVGSNIEISDFSVSEGWTNNSSDIKKIDVTNSIAQPGNITIASFRINVKSGTPETNEKVTVSSIYLTDENDDDLIPTQTEVSQAIRIPSNNASLTKLTVSTGTLSPEFDPDKLEYAVDNVNSDTINISASGNANASISGVGTKKLEYGINTFEIIVKAESGVTKTYKISVNRVDTRSGDTSLKELIVSGTKIQLSNNTNRYIVELASDIDKLSVEAIANNSKATVKYSSNNISLNYDETATIWINVTAENNTVAKYLVTATRKDNRSSNNNLKLLSVNDKSISLNNNTQSYTLTVANKITSATIKALPQDDKSKVEIEGNSNLKVGSNTFKITVTAENNAIKTYSLTIIRKNTSGDVTDLSNNTFVKKLTIKDYDISFDKNTFSYNIEVENTVTKLDITYELEDSKASASITGNSNFKEGNNEVKILVTAENGESSTYVINVTKSGKLYEVENNKSKIISALKDKVKSVQILVKVNDSDSLIIPNDIIKEVSNSNKSLTYSVINGNLTQYSITLNGALFDDYASAVNYKIIFNNNTNLKDLLGNKKSLILDFEHAGQLPAGTVYKVYVGDTFNDGNTLYFYYYDGTVQLQLEESNLLVEAGYITIPLEHCSTYVLVDTVIEDKQISPETPSDNEDNNMLYIIIGSGIIVLLVGGLVIYFIIKKKQKNKKDITPKPNDNLDATETIDIIDLDDTTTMPAVPNSVANTEYLFGISVMDIDDYLEKCPLAGIKRENIKEGIVVVSLEKDSILNKLGIIQGDVLLEFNDKKIINKETFRELIKNIKHGKKYKLKFHRNGKDNNIEVIL